jgi:hypothetical protein
LVILQNKKNKNLLFFLLIFRLLKIL